MQFNKILMTMAVALTGTLVSCGHGDVSERIAAAEMAYASQDVTQARRLCDDIVGDSAKDGSITATELARLSLMYMQLYDRTDDTDALELAAKCYREAYAADADSAGFYYAHLPVDLDNYALTLAGIVDSIDHPVDIDGCHDGMDDCQPDSI